MRLRSWASSAKGRDKLVLLAVEEILGDQEAAEVPVPALIGITGLSDSSVRRSMQALAQGGHIEVEMRPNRASLVSLPPCQIDRAPIQPDRAGASLTAQPDRAHAQTDRANSGRTETTTVLQERSPPVVPPGADRHHDNDDDNDPAPEPQHRPPGGAGDDVDPERWQALEEAIAGRTLDKRGRFMGQGLTAFERSTVRRFVAQHGLAVVEEIVDGMPGRVDQPTGMLAARLERRAEQARAEARARLDFVAPSTPETTRLDPSSATEAGSRMLEAALAELEGCA